MSKARLHLPDCTAVRLRPYGICDCGRPPHPLPANKKIVRIKGRLKMVGVRHPGKDVNAPRLRQKTELEEWRGLKRGRRVKKSR